MPSSRRKVCANSNGGLRAARPTQDTAKLLFIFFHKSAYPPESQVKLTLPAEIQERDKKWKSEEATYIMQI